MVRPETDGQLRVQTAETHGGCRMEEMISSTAANREFARLLRGVREGRRYVVVSHGQPVARLVPAGESGATAARAALLERLAHEPAVEVDTVADEPPRPRP